MNVRRRPPPSTGQKLDSGLGELPHYRLWADKSGKNVVGASVGAGPNGLSAASAQTVPPASVHRPSFSRPTWLR